MNKKDDQDLSSDPSPEKLSTLFEHYKNGRFSDAESLAATISQEFPQHPFSWKVLGLLFKQLGRVNESVAAMQRSVNLAPQDAEAQNNLGVMLQELGRFEEAETSFTEAVSLSPDYALAHYNLGNTLKEMSRLEEAMASYTRAIAIEPNYTEAHNNMGHTLQELGKFEESEASLRRAILLKPGYAEAYYNLGNTLKGLGRSDESEASYNQAILFKPDYAEAFDNLGNTLRELGRLDEAEASHRKAIALQPDLAEAYSNLGVTLQNLGRLDEAEASYSQALALKPDLSEIHFNLGNALRELGSFDEATASYNQAILLKPDYAEAYSNLGLAQRELGRSDEATVSYKQAIMLKPNYAEAHNNLGITLTDLGRFDKAESGFGQAIEFNPDFAEAHSNLGNTLRELGRLDDAEASYRKAIALKPDYAAARSNLLFLNSSMKFDEPCYRKELQGFADIVAERVSAPYSAWPCSKSRTELRVGFVSGDFRQHPVGYFLEGLLVQLQSSSIELYAYPTNNTFGGMTERLKALFHSWTPLSGKSDKDAAKTIHDDGVHILIDLSGHTANNRLPVFGWKPAPIQITWLGYFASTGLPEVDFILGDPFVTPKSEAHHFTEKIWQLPESYLCFPPPSSTSLVGRLPALQNGSLTFGCFNNLSKMTDEVVSVRAEILRAVPNSKLFLKDKRLDFQSGRDQILSRFAAHGIFSDRLSLEGSSSREEYLECYHRVDIALSPFPYGGGTTSVEGLWMGVPVITRRGSYFLSHLGESIAYNTNLSDWIANDNEDYIAKAVKYSSDLNTLAELRQGLREKLLETPLYDLPRFAENFENALWEMKESISH